MRHGTTTGYQHHGCRCDECREAVRRYMRAYRRRKGVPPWESQRGPRPGTEHGSMTMYRRHRCRCDACREANRVAGRAYRAQRKAAAT